MKKLFILIMVLGLASISFAQTEDTFNIYDFKMGISEGEVQTIIEAKYKSSRLVQQSRMDISVQVENAQLTSHTALNLQGSVLYTDSDHSSWEIARFVYLDGKLFQIKTSAPQLDTSNYPQNTTSDFDKIRQAKAKFVETVLEKLQNSYKGKIITLDTTKCYEGQSALYDIFYLSGISGTFQSPVLFYSQLNHTQIIKAKINEYDEAQKLIEQQAIDNIKL